MRKNLRQFNKRHLKTIMTKALERCWENKKYSAIYNFGKDLELILQGNTRSYEWSKIPKEGSVLGDVWEYPIGEIYDENTKHIFKYLYAEYNDQQKVIIDTKNKCNDGKDIKRMKKWYILPDGKVMCVNNKFPFRLINNYGTSIYILSIEVISDVK